MWQLRSRRQMKLSCKQRHRITINLRNACCVLFESSGCHPGDARRQQGLVRYLRGSEGRRRIFLPHKIMLHLFWITLREVTLWMNVLQLADKCKCKRIWDAERSRLILLAWTCFDLCITVLRAYSIYTVVLARWTRHVCSPFSCMFCIVLCQSLR